MALIGDKELDSLKDRANLFDSIMDAPCYISFYTGLNGQGSALRQTLFVRGKHYDKNVERKANRMAKKLGACSWRVFKPIGMPGNVYYRDEDERLDLMEENS